MTDAAVIDIDDSDEAILVAGAMVAGLINAGRRAPRFAGQAAGGSSR